MQTDPDLTLDIEIMRSPFDKVPGIRARKIPLDWIVPFRLYCGRIHWSYIAYFFKTNYPNVANPHTDNQLQSLYNCWESQYQRFQAGKEQINPTNPFRNWVIAFNLNLEEASQRKEELLREIAVAKGEKLQFLWAEVEMLGRQKQTKQRLQKELKELQFDFERVVEFRNALNRMEDMIYDQNIEDEGGQSRYPDPGGWWEKIHMKYHLSLIEYDKLFSSRTPLRNDGEVSGDRVK